MEDGTGSYYDEVDIYYDMDGLYYDRFIKDTSGSPSGGSVSLADAPRPVVTVDNSPAYGVVGNKNVLD